MNDPRSKGQDRGPIHGVGRRAPQAQGGTRASGHSLQLVIRISNFNGEQVGISNVLIRPGFARTEADWILTKTDKEGMVRVPLVIPDGVEHSRVSIFAAHFEPKHRLLWLEREHEVRRSGGEQVPDSEAVVALDLQFPEDSTIIGEVFNEHGQLQAGVPICLSFAYPPTVDDGLAVAQLRLQGQIGRNQLLATTDHRGQFTFTQIPAAIVFRLCNPELVDFRNSWDIQSEVPTDDCPPGWMRARTPGRYRVRVRRSAYPEICITVKNAGGQAVSGASVSYWLAKERVLPIHNKAYVVTGRTDQSGTFREPLPIQGPEALSALEGNRFWIAAASDSGASAFVTDSNFDPANTSQTIVLTDTDSQHEIRGRIETQNGAKVDLVRLKLLPSLFAGQLALHATTDAAGEFCFPGVPVPPGDWQADLGSPMNYSLPLSALPDLEAKLDAHIVTPVAHLLPDRYNIVTIETRERKEKSLTEEEIEADKRYAQWRIQQIQESTDISDEERERLLDAIRAQYRHALKDE